MTDRNQLDRKDEIARIAWAIWEDEGRPDGKDEEHWYRATEIVDRGAAADPLAARDDLGDLRAEPGGAFHRQLSAADSAPDREVLTPGPRNPEPVPGSKADDGRED